jgi:uncharacterized protein YndB with AHSA1/START domain
MARNCRLIAAPRDAVWRTLADGHSYADWVVGTSEIRSVDDEWPAPGSRLHYTVGRGPLRHEGHTEVVAVETGQRLQLEAHAWPMGSVHIDIDLTDADGAEGTVVTMIEEPKRGLLARLHNPLGDAVLRLRNVEALRRLARLSTRPG